MKKALRRVPEIVLITLVMGSMLYTCIELLGMRWLAAPFLRLVDVFK